MLHTLPGEKGKGAQSEERVAEAGTESARGGKRERMKTCMSTIPRLVSVVEIIKREYLKTLDGTVAEGGTLSGLHQYNEIGELDEAGFGEKAGNEEEARLQSLARALHGRNQSVSIVRCESIKLTDDALSACNRRRLHSCGSRSVVRSFPSCPATLRRVYSLSLSREKG